VRYRIAVGPIAGRKTLRLQAPGTIATPTDVNTPLTATRDGFSLNASVACGAGERKELERLCRYVARPPLALECLGRDGDGLKGLAARILHHAGTRAGEPIVEVNCAALPKELLESELVGHEAGAFTDVRARRRGLFEQADGGTLFLDEISEMDFDLQT